MFKKIIFLCLIVGLNLEFNPNIYESHKTKMINVESTKQSAIKYREKSVVLKTDSNIDDTIKDFEPDTTSEESDFNVDYYETNNNIYCATKINPDNFTEVYRYTSNIEANLDTLDIDYYYFNVVTDCYVDISILSNSSNYTFDFDLMQYDFQDINIEDVEVVYSDYSYNTLKTYSVELDVGTYFIHINSHGSIPSILSYALQLEVVKKYRKEYEEISNLKFNKQLKGALWASDYVPIMNSELYDGGKIKYYDGTDYGIKYRNYLLEDLMVASSGENINYLTYYIWDPTLIYNLHKVFFYMEQLLASEILANQEIRINFEEIRSQMDSLVEILLYVGEKLTPQASIYFSVAEEVYNITMSIIEYYLPIIDSTTTGFVGLLSNLTSYTDLGWEMDSNNIFLDSFNLEKASTLEPDRTIMIPIGYRLYTDNSNPVNSKNYISFDGNAHDYLPNISNGTNPSLLYTSNYIYYEQADNHGCRGNIYGINENFEILNYADLLLVDEYDVLLRTPKVYSTLNGAAVSINPIDYGNYEWYKFTAPEDGKYYFCSTGNQSITIDIFDEVVAGYSFEGLIDSFIGGYSNNSDSTIKGCYFNVDLYENQEIYLRIRGQEFLGIDQSITFQITNYNLPETVHIHRYDEFIWQNKKQHKAFCDCGEYTIQGHTVISGSNRCIDCGGVAEVGFVPIQSLEVVYVTENGSYMLPNGTIILVEEDIKSYFKGTLVFELKDNSLLELI